MITEITNQDGYDFQLVTGVNKDGEQIVIVNKRKTGATEYARLMEVLLTGRVIDN